MLSIEIFNFFFNWEMVFRAEGPTKEKGTLRF